ncbi:MAG: ribosome silencing factor [Elusimicrobia bacterium]|nr:ribosome silencing factor [Elusimicrobiota bacterium]
MARAFRTVALALARAASDKKGEAIAVLSVAKTSPVTDYMVIVTANSSPHLEALEHEIERAAGELKARCLRRSKPQSAQWRVLDYGGILVHLMTAASRDFYGLEKLYHGAPRLSWEKSHA